MNTINKCYEFRQDIKKSEFICTLIPVNSLDEINEHLKQIRKKYRAYNEKINTFL